MDQTRDTRLHLLDALTQPFDGDWRWGLRGVEDNFDLAYT